MLWNLHWTWIKWISNVSTCPFMHVCAHTWYNVSMSLWVGFKIYICWLEDIRNNIGYSYLMGGIFGAFRSPIQFGGWKKEYYS